MAKSSENKSSNAKSSKAKPPSTDETIEDATVLSDDSALTDSDAVEDKTNDDAPATDEGAGDTPTSPDAEEPGVEIIKAEASEVIATDAPATQDDSAESASDTADDVLDAVAEEADSFSMPVPPPPAAPHEPPRPPKRGGFAPLFLGGVIAACLGAGVIYMAQGRGWINLGGNTEALTAMIEEQSNQIAVLEASLQAAMTRIDEVATAEPDLAPMTSALDGLQASTSKNATELEALSTSVAALDPRLTELGQRIQEVETQPIPKAELPAEVTAAYERQLADMLASVDTRFGALETSQAAKITAIETALNDKLTALEAAQAAAVASEEDLALAAQQAAARSALAQIEVALDSGTGFAEELQAITDNTDLSAPDALSAVAETGAPTLTALKESFPAAARDALSAATRDAANDGSVSPLSAFLRTQLGARSLEPREGDDPDAVLSRAEAAVASADLDTALVEIATLPQSGQDVLADWVALAETRRAALDAAAALSAQIVTD